MGMAIINVIIIFFVYFFIKYITWKIIEDLKIIPSFINHLPFSCLKCCQTHTLWITYLVIFYILNYNWIILISGIILTVLNAIALEYDQKTKTIDYDIK
jgi:hypothetical protein